MSETSKKIIEEIHERNIKHRPKWYFFIKNAFVWTAFGIAVFLSALSLSIEELVMERGINIHGFASSEFFRFIFQDISFLWIIFTLLFGVLAFLNLRYTGEGYRHRTVWIILGVLLFIMMFGLLLRHEGIDNRAESIIEHSRFYNSAFPR